MPKLGCFVFGKRLIQTKDLDPVYCVIKECKELNDPSNLKPWLLAYWCFYDMGTASWIYEGGQEGKYWERFGLASGSKEYSRGRERRHYRGQAAVKSFNYLKARGLQDLFQNLQGDITCDKVMEEVTNWYLFGPWIAFKAADMLERLSLASVAFTNEDVYLFESPLKGAEELRESLSSNVLDKDLPCWAVDTILENLGPMMAPPAMERVINAQEAETVLCKWHAYNNNKYKIGEDIEACHKSLLNANKTRLTRSLLKSWNNLWGT